MKINETHWRLTRLRGPLSIPLALQLCLSHSLQWSTANRCCTVFIQPRRALTQQVYRDNFLAQYFISLFWIHFWSRGFIVTLSFSVMQLKSKKDELFFFTAYDKIKIRFFFLQVLACFCCVTFSKDTNTRLNHFKTCYFWIEEGLHKRGFFLLTMWPPHMSLCDSQSFTVWMLPL